MKKIKILLIVTLGITAIYLIHFFTSIIILDTYQYYESNDISGQFSFFFSYTLEIALVISLIIASLGLRKIALFGFFSSNNYKYFKSSGILFMIVAALDLIYSIYSMLILNDTPELWLQRIFTNFLLFILGLICLISADILKKSTLIKSENDLTI